MPSLFFEKGILGVSVLGGRLALKDFELKDTAKNFNFLGNADLKLVIVKLCKLNWKSEKYY